MEVRMSLSAPAMAEAPGSVLRYFDAVILVVAAPVMLLIGVPALGYCVGAGTWIALRAVGEGVDRLSRAAPSNRELSLRLAYMIGRLFLLALAVIFARNQGGQGDGLAALCVIVFAFTAQLAVSFVNRPRSK
jgi:hypothetical protein